MFPRFLACAFVVALTLALAVPGSATNNFKGNLTRPDGGVLFSTLAQQASPHNLTFDMGTLHCYVSTTGGPSGGASAGAEGGAVAGAEFCGGRADTRLDIMFATAAAISEQEVTIHGLQFVSVNGTGNAQTGGQLRDASSGLLAAFPDQQITNGIMGSPVPNFSDSDLNPFSLTVTVPVNEVLTMTLWAIASNFSQASPSTIRAFIDPTFAFSNPDVTVDFLGGWLENPDFIVPEGVPEPTTALLLACGLVGLGATHRLRLN